MSTPATFALLHLLCRPYLPEDAAQRLAAIEGPIQWPTLLRKLQHFGGMNWVWGHAQSLHVVLPPAHRATLRKGMQREVARAMQTMQTCDALAPLIRGPKADGLLMKGRAVEARAYDEHVLRPSNDLDLLVRPGRRDAVEQWLRRAGWTPVVMVGDGHAQLGHGPNQRGAVDLHEAPLSPLRFLGLGPDAVQHLFTEAVALNDGTRTLSAVAQTALLLGHLHAGVFTDLRHLADAARWLTVVRPDPDLVAATLTRWGGRRCFSAAISAVQRWDAGALPAPWRHLRSASKARDLRWRVWLDRAWHGSELGLVEPPLWLRRVALLSHLDAPASYAWGQLRGRGGGPPA